MEREISVIRFLEANISVFCMPCDVNFAKGGEIQMGYKEVDDTFADPLDDVLLNLYKMKRKIQSDSRIDRTLLHAKLFKLLAKSF